MSGNQSTFRMLDGYRKGLLLLFLYDLGLIASNTSDQHTSLINLHGIDLSGMILINPQRNLQVLIEHPLGFNGIDLSEADLRNADFSNLRLYNCNFEGANFSNSNLKQVVISQCNFYNAIFKNANISGAYFSDCYMPSCNFTKANLSFARFETVHFYSIDFADPETPYHNLTVFTDAILNQTEFHSDVHPDQIKDAIITKGTALPGGSVYDGRYSLFRVDYEPDPSKVDLQSAHPGMGFKKKIICYCVCGRKIEPLGFHDESFLGYWFGLIKHRIYFHGHHLREHKDWGGSDFKRIIDKLSEYEENSVKVTG